MRCVLQLTVYCISLLSLRPLRAMPAADHLDTDRSDLLQKQSVQTDTEALVPEAQSDVSATEPSPAVRRSSDSLAEALKRVASANVRAAASGLAWARPDSGRQILRRSLRTRRNAHHRQHHRQHHHNSPHSKSKEGCPLGTCSVHNLSHRLYQLIGQSGREGSPALNPQSPHSFG